MRRKDWLIKPQSHLRGWDSLRLHGELLYAALLYHRAKYETWVKIKQTRLAGKKESCPDEDPTKSVRPVTSSVNEYLR